MKESIELIFKDNFNLEHTEEIVNTLKLDIVKSAGNLVSNYNSNFNESIGELLFRIIKFAIVFDPEVFNELKTELEFEESYSLVGSIQSPIDIAYSEVVRECIALNLPEQFISYGLIRKIITYLNQLLSSYNYINQQFIPLSKCLNLYLKG